MNRQKQIEWKSKGFRFFDRNSKLFALQIVLLIIVLSAAAVGGTYAYLLINTTPAANDFTVGIARVTINEPSVDPSSVVWGAGTKPVTLSIPSDSISGAVRAAIIPVLKDAAGNIIGTPTDLLKQPTANAIVMGEITLNFANGWDTNWFYKDGYFYYKKVLNPGQTTTQLLSGVTLTNSTPEMTAKYQNIKVKIEVMADVLQADPSALALWGVTVDGSGNIT